MAKLKSIKTILILTRLQTCTASSWITTVHTITTDSKQKKKRKEEKLEMNKRTERWQTRAIYASDELMELS